MLGVKNNSGGGGGLDEVTNGVKTKLKASSGTVPANTFVTLSEKDSLIKQQRLELVEAYSRQAICVKMVSKTRTLVVYSYLESHGITDTTYNVEMCIIDKQSDGTYSVGTKYKVMNDNQYSCNNISLIQIGSNKFVLLCSNDSASSYSYQGGARIVEINGDTITFGTRVSIGSPFSFDACMLTENLCFVITYDGDYVRAKFLVISGKTISIKEKTLTTSDYDLPANTTKCLKVSDSKVLVVFISESGYCYLYSVSLSGNTVSSKSIGTLTDSSHGTASVYDGSVILENIGNDKYLFLYYSNAYQKVGFYYKIISIVDDTMTVVKALTKISTIARGVSEYNMTYGSFKVDNNRIFVYFPIASSSFQSTGVNIYILTISGNNVTAKNISSVKQLKAYNWGNHSVDFFRDDYSILYTIGYIDGDEDHSMPIGDYYAINVREHEQVGVIATTTINGIATEELTTEVRGTVWLLNH